jgi:hypothetical protein
MTREHDPTPDAPRPAGPPRDRDLTPADDPGGAHAKGYSADPNPAAPPLPDPVPLADAPPGGIHVHERDDPGVVPTGRSESDEDSAGDRAAAVR